VQSRPDGSRQVTRSNGSSVTYDRNNRVSQITTRSGATAHVGPSGRVSNIQGRNIHISYGAHGQRSEVVSVHGNNRIVSRGAHYGFVEHPFSRNGHYFVNRTYVVNGHIYARNYARYYYHGFYYYHYVPAFYYGPRFYWWAWHPWAAPVYWGWGWYGSPWFVSFGYYFAPAPYYPDASLWLTDYLLAQNLQAAYDAGAAGAAQGPPPAAQYGASSSSPLVSDEMKAAIADEVRAQLAAERDLAAGTGQTYDSSTTPGLQTQQEQIPDALDPRQRTFLVSTAMDERLSNGGECTLSAGDVLTRIADRPDADNQVTVLVSSSKRNECPSGSQFPVAVADLQEMHNHFREQVDQGLQMLAENQGKNKMPAAPDATARPSADGQAVPDLSASQELQDQLQQAHDTELEVQQAAKQGS
jgi:hypothetical protein